MPRQDGSGSGRQAKKPVTVSEVTEILAASESELNMSTLAQVMLVNFGGMTRFAEEFRRAYDDSRPGSIARTKMLEGLMRIVNLGAPKTNPGDLTNLSDDDLARTIQIFIDKLANRDANASQKETQGTTDDRAGATAAAAGSATNPAPTGNSAARR